MSGMAGTFTLRDEDRSDNRAVIQSEIEFKHNNFSIVGNVASYIDRKYETNATLDFNFEFYLLVRTSMSYGKLMSIQHSSSASTNFV